VLIQFYKI
jgi:hypothetical protein